MEKQYLVILLATLSTIGLASEKIKEVLLALQDKEIVHEENSLKDDDPLPSPPPDDDDPPWDLNGDGQMSLMESYNWWKHGAG